MARILASALRGLAPLLRLPGQGAIPSDIDGAAPITTVMDGTPIARAGQSFVVVFQEQRGSDGSGNLVALSAVTNAALYAQPAVRAAFDARSWELADAQIFLLNVQSFVSANPGNFVRLRFTFTPGEPPSGAQIRQRNVILTQSINLNSFLLWEGNDLLAGNANLPGEPVILFDAATREQIARERSWLPIPVSSVEIAAQDTGAAFTCITQYAFMVAGANTLMTSGIPYV